ncbi:hypothetical protein JVU11DRAFT_11410 [Chiua virens]|nr:hypothetical protein JVU11DRAFT_11410 [Chiua virens]
MAKFIIEDAVLNPDRIPRDIGVDALDLSSQLVSHVFEIALRVYMEDVKTFIKQALEKEISVMLDSTDRVIRTRARFRRIALKEWLTSTYPLSYEKEDKFHRLLEAIDPARNDHGTPFSLQSPTGGGKPVSFFCAKVLHGALKRREPPFIQGGIFQPVVVAALDILSRLAGRRSFTPLLGDTDLRDHYAEYMRSIVIKLKINHVPWAQYIDNAGTRGRRPATIVHTIWLPLGSAEPPSVPNDARYLSVDESRRAEIVGSSDQIARNDPRSSWSACRYRITNFHQILHKTCLPSEWSIRHASISSNHASDFSNSVYTWVENNYDPINNPIHALGLFISLIFAGLVPNVFPPRKLSSRTDWTKSDLQNYFADLPWEERPEKKGATQIEPFITMVSTFVIAILDDRSPLAAALHAHQNQQPSIEQKKILTTFMDKHTNKGISVTNVLLRFRLAYPVTLRAVKGVRWHQDVKSFSPDIFRDKWNDVRQALISDTKYGSYNAVVVLAGEHTAQALLNSNWVLTRGHVDRSHLPSSPRNSSKKRLIEERDLQEIAAAFNE